MYYTYENFLQYNNDNDKNTSKFLLGQIIQRRIKVIKVVYLIRRGLTHDIKGGRCTILSLFLTLASLYYQHVYVYIFMHMQQKKHNIL